MTDALPIPRMHGLTHAPGGPDPIPGLGGGGGGIDFDQPNSGGYLNINTGGTPPLTSTQGIHIDDGNGGILLREKGGGIVVQEWGGGGIRIESTGPAGGVLGLYSTEGAVLAGKAGAPFGSGGLIRLHGNGVHAGGQKITNAAPATAPGEVVVFQQLPTGGGAPSGPAGGVLAGTYPNPGFAADMATQAELDAIAAKIPRLLATQTQTRIAVTAAYPVFDPIMVTPSFVTNGVDSVLVQLWDASTLVGNGQRRITQLLLDGALLNTLLDEESAASVLHPITAVYRVRPAAGTHTFGVSSSVLRSVADTSYFAYSSVMLMRVTNDPE